MLPCSDTPLVLSAQPCDDGVNHNPNDGVKKDGNKSGKGDRAVKEDREQSKSLDRDEPLTHKEKSSLLLCVRVCL